LAQRVFLVQVPVSELTRCTSAICGDPSQRRDLAAELARCGSAHLRRVAASERVAHAAAADQLPEGWGYARNCMPFLIAAKEADGMCATLQALEKLESEDELDAFFIEQAKRLGAGALRLDRHKFKAPHIDAVEAWVLDMLDKSAQLRVKALSGAEDAVADAAISIWVWLGRIFARLRPAFWQGRNRWLGGAALPEAFSLQTQVMTLGGAGGRLQTRRSHRCLAHRRHRRRYSRRAMGSRSFVRCSRAPQRSAPRFVSELGRSTSLVLAKAIAPRGRSATPSSTG
jgi:hypothetical protein